MGLCFKAEGNAPSLSGRSDERCPNRVRLPDPIKISSRSCRIHAEDGAIVNADEGSSWDALGAWEPLCRGIGISKILKKLQLHLAKAVIRWMSVLTVWAIPAEEDGARKVQ
jgi:hypothetical protein